MRDGAEAGHGALRVAVLCSRRAPGLSRLLEESAGPESPYEIVACLSSEEPVPGEKLLEGHGVPAIAHPIRAFYDGRRAPIGDLDVRRRYDRETVELLASHRPELLVLCSYLYILTDPALEAFDRRIVNVHHADLALRDHHGRPRFAGLRAVRDAVFAGEIETRATSHLVTRDVDEGPLLLRSWPFPVAPLVREALAWEAADVLKAYAFAHREWMMGAAWGPMLAATVELIAGDRVRIVGDEARIDGAPGPWELTRRGGLLVTSAVRVGEEGA